ncbi:hypothetical protein CCUS01_10927 [Colletotrichum cuscutae]|uniref:Uncharacterized protein n=1 Tax=Colletotrichum cuscutae TaxID=1209917 RepID=A0AAI9U893_9PEZI|nr:hypothetical protein CCUS01_10927 [Colletotrichum cuscutae]
MASSYDSFSYPVPKDAPAKFGHGSFANTGDGYYEGEVKDCTVAEIVGSKLLDWHSSRRATTELRVNRGTPSYSHIIPLNESNISGGSTKSRGPLSEFEQLLQLGLGYPMIGSMEHFGRVQAPNPIAEGKGTFDTPLTK